MSNIQFTQSITGLSGSRSLAFKAHEVTFYTNGIGIGNKIHKYDLAIDDARDILSWDKRLAEPFFSGNFICYVSQTDRENLPADLKAIFKMHAIFFDKQGESLFDISTKGSYKKTSYAISAYKSLLKLKDFTNQRTQAMVYYLKGIAYEYGLGCGISATKSKIAYMTAADLGDVRAQMTLAHKAKEKDAYEEALKYYRLSADQGSAEAQNELADLYYHGKGVIANQTKAIELFRQSAAQGYELALENLKRLNKSLNGSEESFDLEELESFDESIFAVMPVKNEPLSRSLSPKTLPIKKRPIVHGFKKQLMDRYESAESERSATQSSKRQKMSSDE